MKTSIYEWSTDLLKALGEEVNDYNFKNPFSSTDNSFEDFSRENFIANVSTVACSHEEIYRRVQHFTGNKLLTETLLATVGGQALLSFPYSIMNDLFIDNKVLNKFFKLDNNRQLLYTKNSQGDYFATMYLCCYGLRNDKKNLLLDRNTLELKEVNSKIHDVIFGAVSSFPDKDVLEKTARKLLGFDMAPLGAVLVRFKIKIENDSVLFKPNVVKVAINYPSLKLPKKIEQMECVRPTWVDGCLADSVLYKELVESINDDLLRVPEKLDVDIEMFSKKLNEALNALSMHHYNHFLCLLEDFYLCVERYLRVKTTKGQIKLTLHEDVSYLVSMSLNTIDPELKDLILLRDISNFFTNKEIPELEHQLVILGQFYEALSHYLSDKMSELGRNDDVEEGLNSSAAFISHSINIDFLIGESKKIKMLHEVKIKECEVLSQHPVSTLEFKESSQRVIYAFAYQSYLDQQLEYSPYLTNQAFRISLRDRWQNLTDVVNEIKQGKICIPETEQFIVKKLSEQLGLIQSYLYLLHNDFLMDKILAQPLELILDSNLVGKKNPYFNWLNPILDNDFPKKLNLLWIAYLFLVTDILAKGEDLASLQDRATEIIETLNLNPKNLIQNSLLISNFKLVLENFYYTNRPSFINYIQPKRSEWFEALGKFISGTSENLNLLELLCKFYMGEYDLCSFQDALSKYQKTKSMWSSLIFFEDISSTKLGVAQFLENLNEQMDNDATLHVTYDNKNSLYLNQNSLYFYTNY